MLRFDALADSMAWANRTIDALAKSLKQGGPCASCMSAPRKVATDEDAAATDGDAAVTDEDATTATEHAAAAVVDDDEDDGGFVYPSCGPTIFSLLSMPPLPRGSGVAGKMPSLRLSMPPLSMPTTLMSAVRKVAVVASKRRLRRHRSAAATRDNGANGNSVAKESLPDADVDFVVMNASPLVLDAVHTNNNGGGGDEGVAVPVQDLDFAGERKMLLESRALAGSPTRMCFRHLSAESLSDVLAVLTPKLLHLSGHGDFTRNGEYVMAFESRGGSADLITMDRLKRLVAPISAAEMPELIVLGVCYSENAARIFVDAGAKHVVACKSNTRVMDDSARHFARNFYLSLFRGHTIKRAFDFATAAVHVAIDSTMPDEHRCGKNPHHKHDESCLTPESTKFILLPEEGGGSGDGGSGSGAIDHNVALFEGVCEFRELFKRLDIGQEETPRGEDIDLNDPLLSSVDADAPPSSSPPPKPHLPSQHEHMVGRRAEIHQVVSQLQSHRIVNVYGPRKYGKTLVAMAACHYLKERRRFRHGVFWISMGELREKLAAAEAGEAHSYPAAFDDATDHDAPPASSASAASSHNIQNPEVHAYASASSPVAADSAAGTGLLADSGADSWSHSTGSGVGRFASGGDGSVPRRRRGDGSGGVGVANGSGGVGVANGSGSSASASPPLVAALCVALGVDPRGVDSMAHLLRTIHHWECLIVLDDCATPSALTASTSPPLASDLSRLLLAHTRAARLLVTCVPPFRVSVEVGFVPAHVLVRELPIHDALNLVHQIAPRLRTDEAVQLVRKCRSPYLLRLALLNLVNCTRKSKAGSVGCLDDHGALVDQHPPTPTSAAVPHPTMVTPTAASAGGRDASSRTRRDTSSRTPAASAGAGVAPQHPPHYQQQQQLHHHQQHQQQHMLP